MDEQLTYLSDEWLAAADAAMDGLTPLDSQLAVTMIVNGGPTHRRTYQIVLGPDRVGMRPPGSVDEPVSDVSMTMSWDVAVGVAQGQIGAQRAFLDGDIQLGGDATRLLGHQDALAAIDDRLAGLRSRTDFSSVG